MAEAQRLGPGFEPLWSPRSRVLILGSFPSGKSREQGFFYGHPQNRFWPMLAGVLGQPVPAHGDLDAKRALILQNGLALWDTVQWCTITGASDASIRDVVPNDIAGLLRQAPITAVLCNGAASWRVYCKYALPATGVQALKMPSTSPANAACSLQRLQQEWGSALRGTGLL